MAAALARARLEAAMNSLPPKVQKFINTHIRKGENFELKTELNSEYRERRKEAVKRVIANMTVGKDVSGLFADVLKCMQTDDLELKKLVYLYLMNYAKSQPELVILAVNSFVKDAEDPNPLIRALAVRTMGCLRAERIVDYLTEPLRKALKDRDPYVRKTAAICIAKLYDLKPVLAVEGGFIALLQDLLSDNNPMVVANTVASLREISAHALDQHAEIVNLRINGVILQKLLAALNECTEWGQIFILESLSEYMPTDSNEAFSIIERVTPRLAHANGAVVLSAVRVLLLYLPIVFNCLAAGGPNNPSTASFAIALAPLLRKLGPPLVSLLSCSHEIAYVALRNINIVLQQKTLLQHAADSGNHLLLSEMRMFFCKYNDPQCVKMEKLDVLLKLVADENAKDIIQELAEYAREVDVTFARKAIRCIASCCTVVPSSVEFAVQLIATLLQNQADVSHVVNECVIACTLILRRYPATVIQPSPIPLICKFVETVDEEESRCALLWTIGFHADSIQDAETLLASFFENIDEESVAVQLQMLTAVLYCDLHRRNIGRNDGPSAQLLQGMLQRAMRSEIPDIRDRAFLYWRLLTLPVASSSNALAAVLGTLPPPIKATGQSSLPESVALNLMPHLGTLAALKQELPTPEVYPGQYLTGSAAIRSGPGSASGMEDEEEEISAAITQGARGASGPYTGISTPTTMATSSPLPGNVTRLPSGLSPQRNVINLLDMDFAPVQQRPTMTPLQLGMFLTHESGNGLEIKGGFHERGSAVAAMGGAGARSEMMTLEFSNHTTSRSVISDFAIQFNKNTLGIYPSHGISEALGSLAPGASISVPVKLARNEAMVATMDPPTLLQIAVKSSQGIVYFNANLPDSWIQGGVTTASTTESQTPSKSTASNLIDDLLS